MNKKARGKRKHEDKRSRQRERRLGGQGSELQRRDVGRRESGNGDGGQWLGSPVEQETAKVWTEGRAGIVFCEWENLEEKRSRQNMMGWLQDRNEAEMEASRRQVDEEIGTGPRKDKNDGQSSGRQSGKRSCSMMGTGWWRPSEYTWDQG